MAENKVCVLMGSPRKAGNTSSLMSPFIKEMERKGLLCKQIWLYDKVLQPCRACRTCQKDWTILGCPIEDDMQEIFNAILECGLSDYISSQRLCKKLGMCREGVFLEFISFAKIPIGHPDMKTPCHMPSKKRVGQEAVRLIIYRARYRPQKKSFPQPIASPTRFDDQILVAEFFQNPLKLTTTTMKRLKGMIYRRNGMIHLNLS